MKIPAHRNAAEAAEIAESRTRHVRSTSRPGGERIMLSRLELIRNAH